MKLIDMTVNDFIKEVDSTSPAPGGGSVSALASSLGSSLGRMVGHLTFGKKKYNELDEKIQNELCEKFEKLKQIQDELVSLVDKDTDNFNLVMSAFKFPKETDEEKKARKEAIEKATILATLTPLEMAKLSVEAINLLDIFVEYGNQNAITDVGVAALLLKAGTKGAIYNVKINLPGISDEKMVNDIKLQCENILKEAIEKSAIIEEKVVCKIS